MSLSEMATDPFARIRAEWTSSEAAHQWRLAVAPHAPLRGLVDQIDRIVLELAERTGARIDIARNEQNEAGLELVWADAEDRILVRLRQGQAPFLRFIDIRSTSETASATLAKMLTTDIAAVLEADAAIRAAEGEPEAWACTVARVVARWTELHEGALEIVRRTLASSNPLARIDGAWAAACLATEDSLEALRRAREVEENPAIRDGMTRLLD